MTAATLSEKRPRNLHPNEISKNKEGIQLIWLDENLENLSDCSRIQCMLLELNPAAQFYSDFNRCVDLIESIKDEQVLLIVSDTFARPILSRISNHRTLAAIFIFSPTRQRHEELVNECEKVVGIFSDQDHLIESLQEIMNLVEKQTLTFSLFDQKQKLGRDLSEESASFIWYQMLIYVLRQMPRDQQSKDEMLDMCQQYYQNNRSEIKKIEDFRVNYNSDKAIEWYTSESFLYKLLNKALRIEDIELLHTFRFFIIDLCAALEKESLRSNNKPAVTTFRGTQIPREELKKMRANEGRIISVNGFLSTSRSIDVALAFAGRSRPNAVFQAVLFEIEADVSSKSVIYADIENKTRMRDEEEILFTLNTTFKIRSVNFDPKLNIWKVVLAVTDEGAEKVQEHMILVKQRLNEYSPIVYFGHLLIKELGQLDRGKKYFEMLLKSLPADHVDIAAIHNQIGYIHEKISDLNSALKYYTFAYEIGQKQSPTNYLHLANSLGKIGRMYRNKRCFDQALNCYTQALDIEEENYPGDLVHKAVMIQHIGVVHSDKGNFDTALVWVFRALSMFKRTLAAQHPYTAICLGYIGYVYETKGELDHALDYYHQLLEMDEQCLPLDHPDRSIDLDMVVEIYKRMGETQKALNFCRKKLNDQKNRLGEAHSCIAHTLISMGNVLKEKNSNEALEYYKQALLILEQSKSSDHQAISQCLTSISTLHWGHNMIDDSLRCEQQALDLYRRKLSSNHTKIANSLRNIGIYYRCMDSSGEALRYFNESLLIYRANHNADHEDMKRIQGDIAELTGDLTSIDSTGRTLTYANEGISKTLVITTINDRRQPYAIACTTVSHCFKP